MIISYTEDALVEQPAIALFGELEWETADCFSETYGHDGTLGRETPADVVLMPRLHAALRLLNHDLPNEAIIQAAQEIARDRSAMSPVQANREVYQLLKEGVKVTYTGDDGGQVFETARVIDWNNHTNNDFFLASQFWVSGDMYKRRADLVGFVNGIPLLLVELKKSHGKLENAYKNNIRDYKSAIPQLFWYNAFIMLSNGSSTKIGSTTAEWEHYGEWKKVENESEQGVISLETAIRGVCEKCKFLDLVENFVLYSDSSGSSWKLVAKNHQFLGVNNAINGVRHTQDNKGRLGVFWHTQGSGKSFSMVFFSQKILRKLPGNWTFLIVTDRQELDKQIYQTFAKAGAVIEDENTVRAQDGEHLKQLLREDHRYLFTLIHKFHTRDGEAYPKLSDRSDIIVITDEAHRSQYDEFAKNMRQALPNAAFIGFTGTPLMAGEERTREVFGNYISVYNFKQSIDDGATVPLYYENRIPELQLTNEDLNDDLYRAIDEADLDEDQENKLELELRKQYHLITRDDRLEKVAEDIVEHFTGRGYQGKAMVVCIDKLTAAKMCEKVRKYWDSSLKRLEERVSNITPSEGTILQEKIQYMQETDMAVVVSQSQNELAFFQDHGIDFAPHRRRMITEDLETHFKNSDDPFRIVFVCAMWMTCFDVPSCSTIYLDKPMKNHTLMQTIARANRVFGEKVNGLIVDYVGIFRDIQKALAIYGTATGGGTGGGETPAVEKSELVELLRDAIQQTREFCIERDVYLDTILDSEGFQRIRFIDDAAVNIADILFPEGDDSVEKIILNDDLKRQYMSLAGNVVRLYKAILPDPSGHEFAAIKTLIAVIADKIISLLPDTDIEEVMTAISQVLDDSIAAEGYVISGSEKTDIVDLSKIDFEALKAHFEKGKRRTEAEKLRKLVSAKVAEMCALNRTRTDYYEELQQMIEEYNSGAANVEEFFRRLVDFAQKLTQEEKRSITEGLSEAELAIFDLLTKPDPGLNKKEKQQIKLVAKELLEKLTKDKLVLDWKKRLQTRAAVLVTIEEVLDMGLPRAYSPEFYKQKCDLVYQHVYDSYYGQGKSVYSVT